MQPCLATPVGADLLAGAGAGRIPAGNIRLPGEQQHHIHER